MKHVEEQGEQVEESAEGSQDAPAASAPSSTPSPVPRTRRRLTGDDLQARFDGWAMQHRQHRQERSPEDVARTARRGVGAALGAAIVALVVFSGVSGQIDGSAGSANAARIEGLQQQIEATEAEPAVTGAGDALVEVTDAAAADAKTVAAGQQGFSSLYYQASTEPTANNGSPNKAMLQIAAHRKVLAPHFAESSYLVEGEAAYRWETVDPFDTATEIDPRYPWYVRYAGAKAQDPSSYAWQVESVTADLDEQDAARPGPASPATAQVVWTCRDAKTKTALAWASARYTRAGEKGTFDGLELVVTAAGATDAPKVGGDRSVTVPEIGDLGHDDGTKGKK